MKLYFISALKYVSRNEKKNCKEMRSGESIK